MVAFSGAEAADGTAQAAWPVVTARRRRRWPGQLPGYEALIERLGELLGVLHFECQFTHHLRSLGAKLTADVFVVRVYPETGKDRICVRYSRCNRPLG
jgi:hypothetical protein